MNVVDGKIQSDSTRFRTTGITEAMIEEYGIYFELMNIVTDSEWVMTDRETYTYDDESTIVIHEYFDRESEAWIVYSKDSVLTIGNSIACSYSFSQTSPDECKLASRNQYTYNSGNSMTQMIYQQYIDGDWVNSLRMVVMYTPYGESSVKPGPFAAPSKNIKASLSTNRGSQTLNLTVDNPSRFSISLSDLSGRTVKRIAEHTFSSGTHSIPLNISTPGKYYCKIGTKGNKTVLPLTILR